MTNLNLSKIKENRLYLYFQTDNGEKSIPPIVLTEKAVTQTASIYWNDPDKISPDLKAMKSFQPCSLCSHFEKEVLCLALYPVLSVLESSDNFSSYDKVIAIYKEKDNDIIYVSETDMQNALKYISIMSLIHFCDAGIKYSKYFHGIVPIIKIEDFAKKLYLNIF